MGVLLYHPDVNQELSDYLKRANPALDSLTGEKINLIHFESAPKKVKIKNTKKVKGLKQRPDTNVLGLMTSADSLYGNGSEYKDISALKTELVVDFGEHFLEGEHWRMPALIFFPSFSSEHWIIFELNGMGSEELSKLVVNLSKVAADAWSSTTLPEGDELRQIVREQVFQRFEPAVSKLKLKRTFKKFSGNATILAALSAAIGLA